MAPDGVDKGCKLNFKWLNKTQVSTWGSRARHLHPPPPHSREARKHNSYMWEWIRPCDFMVRGGAQSGRWDRQGLRRKTGVGLNLGACSLIVAHAKTKDMEQRGKSGVMEGGAGG